MKPVILAILAAGVLLIATPALAGKSPQPGRLDKRVKTLVYSEHDVYAITGHYGYQALIQFGANEEIQNISIGDSIAWQVVPNNAGNKLFLKPVEENAGTNMTIVTDRRIYSFELRAAKARGPRDPKITYRVSFSYPEEEMQLLLNREARAERLRGSMVTPGRTGVTPASWNFEYTFGGDRGLVPKRIFDDGEFTYFEFDEDTDTPAIFLVNADRSEALVNHHVEGRYIVVQRTGRQFTLRDGDTVTCIFNETYSDAPDLDLNSPRNRDAAPPAPTSTETSQVPSPADGPPRPRIKPGQEG